MPSMKEIIVNLEDGETRVAVLENKRPDVFGATINSCGDHAGVSLHAMLVLWLLLFPV